MNEAYTGRAQQVMAFSELEARRQGLSLVEPVHLLAALLREGSGVGACTLKALGLELSALQQAIDQVTGITPPAVPVTATAPVGLSPATREIVVEQASQLRRQLGHNYVGTEHILLALLDDQLVERVLDATGVTTTAVRRELNALLQAGGPTTGVTLDASMQELLTGAKQAANVMGHKSVRTEHMLLAALKASFPGPLARFLTEHGITADALEQHLRQHR